MVKSNKQPLAEGARTSLDSCEEFGALANIRNQHPCSLMPLIEEALAGKAVSAIARLDEIETEIAASREEYWDGHIMLVLKCPIPLQEKISAVSAGDWNKWIIPCLSGWLTHDHPLRYFT